MVFICDKRTVYINRNFPSKRLIETIVFRRGRKIFIPTYDMCDTHKMIVYYICKVICRKSIGFNQDHIVQLIVRHCNIPVNLVMECCLSLIRNIQTDHPWFSFRKVFLHFFFTKAETMLVINNNICSVVRNRCFQTFKTLFITEAVISVSLFYKLFRIIQIKSGCLSFTLNVRTESSVFIRSFIMKKSCFFHCSVYDIKRAFNKTLLVCIFYS